MIKLAFLANSPCKALRLGFQCSIYNNGTKIPQTLMNVAQCKAVNDDGG